MLFLLLNQMQNLILFVVPDHNAHVRCINVPCKMCMQKWYRNKEVTYKWYRWSFHVNIGIFYVIVYILTVYKMQKWLTKSQIRHAPKSNCRKGKSKYLYVLPTSDHSISQWLRVCKGPHSSCSHEVQGLPGSTEGQTVFSLSAATEFLLRTDSFVKVDWTKKLEPDAKVLFEFWIFMCLLRCLAKIWRWSFMLHLSQSLIQA